MRVFKKDDAKAAEERAERERNIQEAEARKNYLASLSADPNFRKYVLDDIIRRNINQLTDIRNLPTATPEKALEIVSIINSTKLAQTQLEKILADIIWNE